MLHFRLRQDADSLMALSEAHRSMAKENEQQRIKLESTQQQLEMEKHKVRDLHQQMQVIWGQLGADDPSIGKEGEPEALACASDLLSGVLNSKMRFASPRTTQVLRAPPRRANTDRWHGKRRGNSNHTAVIGELSLAIPALSPVTKASNPIPLPSFTACEEGVSLDNDGKRKVGKPSGKKRGKNSKLSGSEDS
jgi:hypothetical protein